MSVLGDNGLESGGFKITNSLRFRPAAPTVLTRTPTVAGTCTTWTLSLWVKLSDIAVGDSQFLYATYRNSTGGITAPFFALSYQSNQLCASENQQQSGGSTYWQATTTALYRDPSAWYHIVVAYDSTQATASNRIAIYVNGVSQSLTSVTLPSINYSSAVNSTVQQFIGTYYNSISGPYNCGFNGYVAENILVDGLALTPTKFGKFDAVTGVWVPIMPNVQNYGTNGFRLEFHNAGSLGTDTSGKGNNWTLTNIISTDQMVDSPSYNYATLNPLTASSATITNANMSASFASNGAYAIGSMSVSSGKWYWETTCTAVSANAMTGIVVANTPASAFSATTTPSYYYSLGGLNSYGTYTTPTGYSAGNVIGVALDATNKVVYYYVNNVLTATSSYSVSPVSEVMPIVGEWSSGASCSWDVNFGQKAFSYTPPVGYKAICATNLPSASIVKPKAFFDVDVRTGTGAVTSVSGKSFPPDFVWTKSRSLAQGHRWFDSVRGATKYIVPNLAGTEVTDANTITSFNSDGFSLGTDSSPAYVNDSGDSLVDWFWRKSAVSGFDIHTFTAPASGTITVNHNLGAVPKMIILACRSAAQAPMVYHSAVCTTTSNYLVLNSNAVTASLSNAWGTVLPTSASFQATAATGFLNANATYVAYLWAEVAGYSKISSYTGAANTFVYTGFKPKFILLKAATSTSGNWLLIDTARNTYNMVNDRLVVTASVEDNGVSVDILSNGFYCRTSADDAGISGATIIYAAFAENPFGGSNVPPATAR